MSRSEIHLSRIRSSGSRMRPEPYIDSQQDLSGWSIAVTGAGGYLGCSVVAALLRVGARPWRITRSDSTLPSCSDCEDIVSHPAELATWERVARIADAVVHLGAVTSAAAAESDPEASDRAGPLPMRLLAEAVERAAGESRIRVVVTAGSATQYGSGAFHDESAPDRPLGTYEDHKCSAEHALTPLRSRGIRLAFARLANVYGPGKSPAAPDRGVLTRMTERAIGGEPITIWHPGNWLRDYVFLDDAASAMLKLIANGGEEHDGRYLVCSGRSVPLHLAAEFVSESVFDLAGVRVPVQMVPPPRPLLPAEVRHFEGTPARLRKLGWGHTVELKEGLARTVLALTGCGAKPCR